MTVSDAVRHRTEALLVGIDIGGTKVHGLLADRSGRILDSETVPAGAEDGSDAIIDRIYRLAGRLLPRSVPVAAIGIGAPGPLDVHSGVILRTENLPFRNLPIAAMMNERFGIKTVLENDGSAAAFGEYCFGPAKGSDPLLYLTVSTGIGAGAVLGGKVYRGKNGNALEAGHIPLLAGSGPACACGGRGCVEALASGKAIAAKAAEAARHAREGRGLPTLLSSLAHPSAADVFSVASRGDAVADHILSEALDFIGSCAATLAVLFDPEAIIVGGGLTRSGPRVGEAVRAAIAATPTCSAGGCTVLSPGLGDDAGALGAAAIAANIFELHTPIGLHA
jgi:glucokinase